MRRTSPCTLIIGGNPADRCKSEAALLTEKASSSAMSMVSSTEKTGCPALHDPPKNARLSVPVDASDKDLMKQIGGVLSARGS